MKKTIHPTILFLNKFSVPMLSGILIWYLYALLVARSEFSRSVFVVLLSLGLVALGLIAKSAFQAHNARSKGEINEAD